ncbi:MAG: PEP/pyruvate-binding domain-containing protein, partial [Desulfarculaceae bacterium]|nr:PEP/pyruvate-binding domain-containing protein [Desulfarculaceae bacterium]
MAGWWQKLRRLVREDEPPADEAGLSEEFKARYLSFRKLLAANNKALELMAEMEAAAGGGRVFGMSFLRARATALGVSVFTMASQLERLAPGKYPGLLPRLKQIQNRLEDILAPAEAPDGDDLVLPLAGLDQRRADEAGAKMANLGEMRNRLGLRVPPGFVITAAAWRLLLESSRLGEEIWRLQQAADMENAAELFTLSSRLRQLIVQAPLPPALEEALERAYASLAQEAGGPVRVSLRSSAIGEDSAEASFAGQYATQLNVAPEFLASTYQEVAASFFNPQPMHYRLMPGLRDDQLA